MQTALQTGLFEAPPVRAPKHKPVNPLKRSEYEVRPVPAALARTLIAQYHYAKSAPITGVHIIGLFKRGDTTCLGVTWWMPPIKAAAVAAAGPHWRQVLNLNRSMVVPGTPTS